MILCEGRKSKEESFDNTWKLYEIEISVSPFIGSQPCSFICILSVAAWELKWQTWAWPVKPKIFYLSPFTESFCQPLAESVVFFMLGMGWPPKTRFGWCRAFQGPAEWEPLASLRLPSQSLLFGQREPTDVVTHLNHLTGWVRSCPAAARRPLTALTHCVAWPKGRAGLRLGLWPGLRECSFWKISQH